MANLNSRHRIKANLSGILGVMLCCCSTLTQSQSFGILFTTPDEREYLDYLRQDFVTRRQLDTFNIEEDLIPVIPTPVNDVQTEIVRYQFGGIMTRINGNKMIWLNGRQVPEQDLPENLSLVNSAQGTLLNIRINNSDFFIKPGQTINGQTGIILDSYQASDTTINSDSVLIDEASATESPREPEPTLALNTTETGDDINPVENAQSPESFEAFLELIELSDTELSSDAINTLQNAFQQAQESQ